MDIEYFLKAAFLGKHPDPVIDQSVTKNERFRVGDFITFTDINGSIVSPTRIRCLFDTRIVNNRLQVLLLKINAKIALLK